MDRLPKYVQKVVARGQAYYYLRRYGKRTRLPDPSNWEAFSAAYAAALKGAPATPKGRTFSALIARYYAHRRYKKLSPRTKADYEKVLAYIEKYHGERGVTQLPRPAILDMQHAVADVRGHRFANYCVQVLSIIFRLAQDMGWIETNPAAGIEKLQSEGEMHHPWPPEAREAFEASASPRGRLLYELCIGTGQRIGDVLKMRWEDVRGGAIHVQQSKTGATLEIPLTARLAAYLDGVERVGVHIAARDLRRPLTYSQAHKAIISHAKGYTIHGLRYTAAAELAEAGCSDELIASITGHKSLSMVAKYSGAARQRARAQKAQEKRK